MTNTATTAAETHSVVIEREMPYPPEKLWRALTQPHLIEEWLMKNDFKPVVGHRFKLRGDWGGVLDCKVLTTSLWPLLSRYFRKPSSPETLPKRAPRLKVNAFRGRPGRNETTNCLSTNVNIHSRVAELVIRLSN